MVTALAAAAGHRVVRINLSEQTDIMDLLGSDLPVEGGKGGEFAWRDGVFLQALNVCTFKVFFCKLVLNDFIRTVIGYCWMSSIWPPSPCWRVLILVWTTELLYTFPSCLVSSTVTPTSACLLHRTPPIKEEEGKGFLSLS